MIRMQRLPGASKQKSPSVDSGASLTIGGMDFDYTLANGESLVYKYELSRLGKNSNTFHSVVHKPLDQPDAL